jgi:protein-tyrosine phosphatase
MTPDVYWIAGPWRGRLAVATRPRGGDWLDDEAYGWRQAGLDIVVSLLEKDEAVQLELAGECESFQASGIQFISYPIRDRATPSAIPPVLALLHQLRAALDNGKNIAIHCRQGIGRSGTIAAALLLAAGVDLDQAIDTVSRARGLAIPETPEQLRWLQLLATDPRVAGRESDTETPPPPSSTPPELPSPASRKGTSEPAAPGRAPI